MRIRALMSPLMSELSKLILEMRTILYGDDQSEPVSEVCARLTEEFFKDDNLRLLIISLHKLDLGARQDATRVVANLQRQRVNSRLIASDYLEVNLDLIDILICRLRIGSILWVTFEGLHPSSGCCKSPNFGIASDAAATFKELLTRHKSTVAEFLSKNYEWFFKDYNIMLLESPNYITRRHAVKLLGEMLLDRSNCSVMVRYVSSLDNMRILMNLLRDSNSRSIQFEAFHVFKLFAGNQNKPPEIVNVLVTNRSKLINFLGDFRFEKD